MTLHGVDISNWQAGFDVKKCAGQFMIAKATEGTTFVDKNCDGFVQQAKAAGIPWGVYHFAHDGGDDEVDFFVKQVKGYVKGGILVLDWEADAVSKGVSAAKNFLDGVYSETGVRPLIYMSASVVTGSNWSSVYNADYGLWVAAYQSNAPTAPWGSAGYAMSLRVAPRPQTVQPVALGHRVHLHGGTEHSHRLGHFGFLSRMGLTSNLR